MLAPVEPFHAVDDDVFLADLGRILFVDLDKEINVFGRRKELDSDFIC